MNINDELFKLQIVELIEAKKRFLPGLPEEVIGCSDHDVRVLARKIVKANAYNEFLHNLPHKYHEEYVLHGYILSYLDVSQNELFELIEEFLPYVSNCQVCDNMAFASKALISDKECLLSFIKKLVKIDKTYYVRFAVMLLSKYYLKKNYIDQVIDIITHIGPDDHYVNLSIAMLLEEACYKYFDHVIYVLKNRLVDPFIHNKVIKRAQQNSLIDESKKEQLKLLFLSWE